MAEQNKAPNPQGGEQRTTASIMFTDVVGFSRHSAIDEERTYRALNRDFDLIYRQVAANGGQVLNTMGDGMMVVFFSSTACMECALGIQSDLHTQALSRPQDGVLQHRIGLHIGDIILNGKNTMGDGVNQTARIQSLARPDSIAMSREFHSLVEDKVRFTSKYLGPRITRNIPEPIPIFEVPPIDDLIKQRTAEALFSTQSPEASTDGATGRRSVLILALVAVFIAIAALPIFLIKSGDLAKNGRTFGPGTAGKDVAKRIKEKIQSQNAPEANNDSVEANNAGPGTISLTPDQVADIAAKTNSYDYAGIAAELVTAPGANSNDGMIMIKKYESLVQFKSWMEEQVSAATETAPISITLDGQTASVFATPDGVVINNGAQGTPKKLWEYKPQTIEAIAEAVSAKPTENTTTTATPYI